MIQQQLKNVAIETGFNGDTVIIKLNPPVIENEEQVILRPTPLEIKTLCKKSYDTVYNRRHRAGQHQLPGL